MEINLKRLNSVCGEWRDFGDDYFVGDDGNLYKRLKSNYQRAKEHPYQQVRQTFGTGEQHTVKVHKAVALAFIPNPDRLSDIDHINNDKTDNRVVNLQWLSHRDNIRKQRKDREQK